MAQLMRAASAGSGKGKSDPGGGPGTQASGPVKTTMTNPLGKRVAGKRGSKRGGRSR